MARKGIKNKLTATAFHEAGHAVVAILQGLHVEAVSVRRRGDANGSCLRPSLIMYNGCDPRERKELARSSIITNYAGIEAERLFDSNAPEWHGKADFENAFNTSREYAVLPRNCAIIGDDAHLKYLQRLRVKARQLVGRHRSTIEKVADLLIRQRTLALSEDEKDRLTGQEVEQSIEKILASDFDPAPETPDLGWVDGYSSLPS